MDLVPAAMHVHGELSRGVSDDVAMTSGHVTYGPARGQGFRPTLGSFNHGMVSFQVQHD